MKNATYSLLKVDQVQYDFVVVEKPLAILTPDELLLNEVLRQIHVWAGGSFFVLQDWVRLDVNCDWHFFKSEFSEDHVGISTVRLVKYLKQVIPSCQHNIQRNVVLFISLANLARLV